MSSTLAPTRAAMIDSAAATVLEPTPPLPATIMTCESLAQVFVTSRRVTVNSCHLI